MTTADNLDANTSGHDLDMLFAFDATSDGTPRHRESAPTMVRAALPVIEQRPLIPSAQWKAETFQLVNWGGFSGRHVFRFSPGATLISGASGTGKSTLLDAYIALMMPADTLFNGASNDAVAGRARSGGQRNLLTYLRGKTDTTTDDGREAELLAPITDLHATLERADAQLATLNNLGLNEPRSGVTALALWQLRTERQLLAIAVTENSSNRSSTTAKLRTARTDEDDAIQALRRYQQAHHEAGGGTIEQLDRDIERLAGEQRQRADRRHRLAQDTAVLATPLATRRDHENLLAAAADFLGRYDAAAAALRSELVGLLEEQHPLMAEKRRIRAERESLAGRQGRVDKGLDDNRKLLAAAAGMDPADLPFIAELIDVHPDHARWRTAIETVLYGTARTLLVPLDRLEAFSRAIDDVQLRGRVTFEGAEHALHEDIVADPRTVAGKLVYKDSPFSRWLGEHLKSRGRNALCVESAADLAGPEFRVTVHGQTRQGRRGAHGRQTDRHIIGFSNVDAIADLADAEAALDEQLDGIGRRIAGVHEREGVLTAQKSAHEAAARSMWGDIDDAGVAQQIQELRKHREDLLAGDSKLKELSDKIDALTADLNDRLTRNRMRLEDELRRLVDEHAKLADREDDTNDKIDHVENQAGVVLTDEDAQFLDAELAAAVAPATPDRLDAFDANMVRLFARLQASQTASNAERKRSQEGLIRIFEQYQTRWEDPNLGTTLDSYREYAEILDNIRRTGLHERRAEWRRRLTAWSGEDLVPLAHAMHSAIEEIEDRLIPINSILAGLPFGAGRDRLSIKLRRLSPVTVTTFAKELRDLASGATREVTDAETERRFKALQSFMAKIRRRDDTRLTADLRANWDRDNLLDVRRHVEITAERHNLDGQLLSTHSSLGGKSGGESQELVAFIVGAALRFRLGDELRARPRFAPVFLDEGFIKSDSEFAGRAVQAWKGLGFQLIIGAPLDKVSALEAHADDILVISKNTATSQSHVFRLHDAPARVEAVTHHGGSSVL